jgi:O-antigen/teichoic acid export membrane protein
MLTKTWWTQLIDNNRSILVNASSLVGTLLVTSGLGFAYWWVVARQFEPAEAGLSAAIISAMQLLGTVGMMGMGTLMIGELARHPKMVASLIASALLISGGASMALGLAFAPVAATFSDEFLLLLDSWSYLLLFTAGVTITGMVLVLDQALLGLLRGSWQLWRNAAFAFTKLLLLWPAAYLFYEDGSMAIYATWLAGNLLSLLFLAGLIGGKRLRRSDYRPRWDVFRELKGMALAHHVLNLSLQTVQFALPVIVTVLLSPEVNASFYVAWLIASSLFIVPSALTQALYAVSAADVTALAHKIRFTVRTSFIGVLLAGLVIFALAEWVLAFFNPSYALTSAPSLRLLLLASFPIIIRVHYVAICQIRRELRRAALIFLLVAVLEVTAAIVGALVGGLIGLTVAWVAATYLQALFMLPAVWRAANQVDAEATAVGEGMTGA